MRGSPQDEYRLEYDDGTGSVVLTTSNDLEVIKERKRWFIENRDIYPTIFRRKGGSDHGGAPYQRRTYSEQNRFSYRRSG